MKGSKHSQFHKVEDISENQIQALKDKKIEIYLVHSSSATFRSDCKNGFIYSPIMLKSPVKADFLLLQGEFIVSQTKPALGMVYKIQEINGKPTIKFSEDKEKTTIPGQKQVIRVIKDNKVAADLLIFSSEEQEKAVECYIKQRNVI